MTWLDGLIHYNQYMTDKDTTWLMDPFNFRRLCWMQKYLLPVFVAVYNTDANAIETFVPEFATDGILTVHHNRLHTLDPKTALA